MITIEDKIKLFEKIVLDDIKKEISQLKEEIEDNKEKELKEYRKKVEENAEDFVEKFVNEAEEKKKKEIAQSKRIQKERILDIKNTLIERVYQSVLDRCKEFIEEDKYIEVFENLVVNAIEEFKEFKKVDIYLIEEDFDCNYEKIDEILSKNLKDTKYKIEKSDEDFYGGFIAYNENETVKINSSLKSIITKNKGFIGNQVHSLLDELGDLYER